MIYDTVGLVVVLLYLVSLIMQSVSVASCSCLSKRIKSSFRNRLNETNFDNLMLVSLESPAFNGLNVDRAIGAWARKKQSSIHVN